MSKFIAVLKVLTQHSATQHTPTHMLFIWTHRKWLGEMSEIETIASIWVCLLERDSFPVYLLSLPMTISIKPNGGRWGARLVNIIHIRIQKCVWICTNIALYRCVIDEEICPLWHIKIHLCTHLPWSKVSQFAIIVIIIFRHVFLSSSDARDASTHYIFVL